MKYTKDSNLGNFVNINSPRKGSHAYGEMIRRDRAVKQDLINKRAKRKEYLMRGATSIMDTVNSRLNKIQPINKVFKRIIGGRI